MAKDANVRAKQKTLTSFFKRAPDGKGVSSDAEFQPEDDVKDDEDDEDVNDHVEAEVTISNSKKAAMQKTRRIKGRGKRGSDDEGSDDDDILTSKQNEKEIAYNLPPMHDLPTIFSDLVSRVPQVLQVAKWVQGRKLRVATMCSGTESPLLALDLMRRSILAQHDINLDVEHVFSCEIEPFKQAYIERNFHPPLLFRDVCELGDGQAHTAYGSLEEVPGNVDLLIAGTSCVDYSNLNNEKQQITAKGESGRTFFGMLAWVKNHRPPLVIIENVMNAPWSDVKRFFGDVGYTAIFSKRLDTKNFYIPHTRTRGYLIAVDEKKSDIPDQWLDLVLKKLKRQASSTLDAFLLPSDDPRIHQARRKLVQESYNALDRKTGRTDWGRCESRHQRARLEEELGSKRPLTSWEEGGSCKVPDYAWADWAVGQVERVWDLMDISYLRSAKKGIDVAFKTQVWNLSQNVDRNVDSNRLGVCQCLTPSMIPYITNRGGPMVGMEALSMQGLPIDELLLTRETEDQLADLAGNAMSTTVVGACILAALVTGRKLLSKGPDEEMDITTDGDQSSTEDRILGEDKLIEKPLDLSIIAESSLTQLLVKAEKSARLCECEGRNDMTDRQVLRCIDCGSPSCKKCRGRPEQHNMTSIDLTAQPRLSPSTFSKELKSTLPMCISLVNVTQELLDSTKDAAGVCIAQKPWNAWCSAVLRAVKNELRFVEPKRQEIWTAVYKSSTALAELSLHPQQPEWRLYAKAEDSEPGNAEIRHLLEMPVGRFTCINGLLSGRWQFALPHTTSIPITIEGIGDLVPAWEAGLGLQGDDYKDLVVHSKLKFTVPADDISKLDRDISGEYVLLDKCGTANGALHRKAQADDEKRLPPLFMFLDPTRCGRPDKDCFLLSISKRRYEYGESRPIVCRLDSSWRQSSTKEVEEVVCYVPIKWETAETVKLQPSLEQDARFCVPERSLDVVVSGDACRSAIALLVCRIPFLSQAGPEWGLGMWKEVEKLHERGTFKSLAWLLERIRHVDDNFGSWQQVELSEDHSRCERCAPTAPKLRWHKEKNKWVAREDDVQAGEYERLLKGRPTPFVTQLKLNENSGTVRIGINIPSLLHRALSRLPSANRTDKPSVSWRLNTDFTPAAKQQLPKFRLSSNKLDKPHAQPPSFKLKLRPEQTRSLEWMIRQEDPDAPPFIEEEIAEAILEPLGWRAEARAQRAVHVRGGVLADQVGYGKTAITLGLIDCTQKVIKNEVSKMPNGKDQIHVKATLVIVPPHLTRQWESEVKKFAPNRFKVKTISTASNLNALTIEDVQEADILVVASNLFHSSVYLANLEALSGAGTLPSQDGRYFNAKLEDITKGLRKQTLTLIEDGPSQVMKEIKEGRKREEDIQAEAKVYAPTKRLKGKSYRDAVAAASPNRAKKAVAVGNQKTSPFGVKQFSTKATAKATPSGLIPEVFIDHPPSAEVSTASSPPATSSAAEETADDDIDVDIPRQRPRRLVSNKAIILSDDDDDVELQRTKPTLRRAPAARKGSSNRKPLPSSDDGDYHVETASDDETDEGSAPSSGEDDHTARSTGKPLGVKTVINKPQLAGSDDGMDVDEPQPKTTKSRKRPSDGGEERPTKKQKRREDTDPWKLESNSVNKDWTQMHSPPLEMFHFARKVVDEYTYLDGKILSMVLNITADRLWVLSGTPPIHDFGALKTIAAFLDIHLGVDDDAEGQSALVKKRRREQTAVEKFHSFREVHSLEWHAHRHQSTGQTFLDRYVRQNIAEIDEIPSTDKLQEIVLPAAERAIYLELEHHLRALDMAIKRGKKTESDREKRLAKALGDSSTAEEALLKRCSHFDLETTDNDNAVKACDVIVRERQKQLDECKKELLASVTAGAKRERNIGHQEKESLFMEWVRVSRKDVEDSEASDIVVSLIDKADVPAPLKNVTNKAHDGRKGKGKGKDDDDMPKKLKDEIWDHRERTHDIRRLTKELVGRVRSLRYFTVVRDLQKQKLAASPRTVHCPGCRRDVPTAEAAVLSSCGHTGCLECVEECAKKEECVYAADGSCKSAARVLNVVRADSLGEDDETRDGRGKHFGMKLENVVHLIKKDLPKEDRVLIFVQFPDLMKKVAEALTTAKIKYLEIKGSASVKSKNLEKFQNDSEERVLLLNVMDESASGANLTSANHAIFLSPLLAPTQEIYDACETQAIGRLRRYGQTNHVYVWRFLTTNTIDEEIYKQRTIKLTMMDVDEA